MSKHKTENMLKWQKYIWEALKAESKKWPLVFSSKKYSNDAYVFVWKSLLTVSKKILVIKSEFLQILKN